MGKSAARRILDFFDNRVANHDNPRSLGQALTGPLGTLWRYRIGDYRAICEIQDNVQHKAQRVLVIRIGHRREIYP